MLIFGVGLIIGLLLNIAVNTYEIKKLLKEETEWTSKRS